MTTKRQFLDPIGAGCRFVLLKLHEPNTKIRITDHTVQLVSDHPLERYFYRPWIYRDSREDIAALYPVIVRFIELYLIPKKNTSSSESVQPQLAQSNSRPTLKPVQKQKQHSGFDMFNEEDEFGCEDDDIDDTDQFVAKPVPIIVSAPVATSYSSSNGYSAETYEALKTIAKYMIEGLKVLEKTYEYGNCVFTLQFYVNLLNAGINGTYTQDFLPPHLKDFTTQNFLDNDKIKSLWKDDDIIQLGNLLKQCFESMDKKSPMSITAYRAAINSMLDDRDMVFKQMVSSTNNA